MGRSDQRHPTALIEERTSPSLREGFGEGKAPVKTGRRK
jgi:hypothetical protein